MKQTTLFDIPEPTPSLARNSDPISSHLAAEETITSGRRDSQKRDILKFLKTYSEPVTSMELAHRSGMDRYIVARRLPDLEKDYKVERGPMRECRISGRMAITWRAR